MRFNCIGVFAALALATQLAAAQERAPLKGVTSVRVANYGAPSVLLKAHEQVSEIVGEFSALRKKPWRKSDTRLSCYSTVTLMSGEKMVALFRVRPEVIVERPVEKGRPQEKGQPYSIAIDEADILSLSRVLAEIPPAKNCN